MTQHPPSGLVVVGASAGGVEALRGLAAALTEDLDVCVLVVLHVPPRGLSNLPSILSRAGTWPARHAADGDALTAGQILVAPPDHHLLVLDGRVSLTRGPQENGHRPAVDVLFRSAARAWGSRVVGLVLSGSLDDGAAGAVAVTARGGHCVVQDFDEALFDAMPRAAAAAGRLDEGVRAAKMPDVVREWMRSLPGEPPADVTELMRKETDMAELDPHEMHDPDRPGTPAGFGCPDCAGSLYEIDEGQLRRYRCRVGHAWSPESLLARQSVAMESALWMALRSLEEKAALSNELGARATANGMDLSAARFGGDASETLRAAELVRGLISEIGQHLDGTDS